MAELTPFDRLDNLWEGKPLNAARGGNGGNGGNGVDKIIFAESGGKADAKNPKSSAQGAGQFISSTWSGLVDRFRPEWKEGLTPQQVLDLRNDPEKSAEMVERYRGLNAKVLQSAGLPVNDATLYLSHMLDGPMAAKVLLSDSGADVRDVIGEKAYNANLDKNGRFLGLDNPTVGNYVGWAERKMGGKTGEGGAGAAGAASGDFSPALGEKAPRLRVVINKPSILSPSTNGPSDPSVPSAGPSPFPASLPAPDPSVPSPYSWNGLAEGANNVLFGAGVPLSSMGMAALGAGKDIINGQPVWETLGNIPQRAVDNYGALEKSRLDWRDKNTGTALASEIASTLIPIGMVGGAVNTGIKAGAAAAGRALPMMEGAASSVGRFLTGQAGRDATGQAAKGVGNFVTRRASDMAAGAVQGATAATMLSPLHKESFGDQVQAGALGGAALAPFTTPLLHAATSFTRGKLDKGKDALAKLAEEYGISFRGAHLLEEDGGSFARRLDDVLIGKDANQEQTKNFTKAIARELGEPEVERLTPAAWSQIENKVKQDFKKVENATNIPYDSPELAAVLRNTMKRLSPLLQTNDPKIDTAVRSFAQTFEGLYEVAKANGGMINGKDWQRLTDSRSVIGRLDKKGDLPVDVEDVIGEFRRGLGGMYDIYAPEGMKSVLQNAQQKWRTLKIIEPLVAKSPTGILNPTALHGSVVMNERKQGSRATQALRDLARIGQELPKPKRMQDISGEKERKGLELVGDLLPEVMKRAVRNPILTAGSALAASPLVPGVGFSLLNPVAAGSVLGAAAGVNAATKRMGTFMSSPAYTELLRAGGIRPEKNWGVYPEISRHQTANDQKKKEIKK